MNKKIFTSYREEVESFLTGKLLPFWLDRCLDKTHGGFITHFDKNGKDTGEDEKSLIAQARTVYTMASAHRAGYGGGLCETYAKHGFDYLINRMWDEEFGGFFWMTDRKGAVTMDDKIVYGQSFAIYALSEYTLATGDDRGLTYAEKTFDLLQKYAADTMYGGYFEMFDRRWDLAGPGSGGGDRKTLDVHMHLMEAFTTLYEASGKPIHKRKLLEDIRILLKRLIHPVYATGVPQFWPDWRVAPQIKFDIVWGWDRFSGDGVKANAEDNCSYGHNVELAWLLMHACDVLGRSIDEYKPEVLKMLDHTVANGIDYEYGGVFVEGPHAGGVHDREKEFWQQCEVMIGMLEALLRFDGEKYLKAYDAVHRFMFTKGVNFETGELWPLLSREGVPIWTHMSHSWKVNYHSVRAMIQCSKRLLRLGDV